MDKFPSSEQILASTVHRDSAQIRLLAGIYDLLRELASRPAPSDVTTKNAKDQKGSRLKGSG